MNKQIGYRLIDVLDLEGNSKAKEKELYSERIDWVASEIRKDRSNNRYYITFSETADGKLAREYIHTSVVSKLVDTEESIKLYTKNSIYVFDKVELKSFDYKEEPELIELFLDNDSYKKFCKGVYYDQNSNSHDLDGYMHVGMTIDTYLIGTEEGISYADFICRYYLKKDEVEFYDTLYGPQDYSTRMLIHNVGMTPLVIKFEMYPAAWTIQPGEEKYIVPYTMIGADERKDIVEEE